MKMKFFVIGLVLFLGLHAFSQTQKPTQPVKTTPTTTQPAKTTPTTTQPVKSTPTTTQPAKTVPAAQPVKTTPAAQPVKTTSTVPAGDKTEADKKDREVRRLEPPAERSGGQPYRELLNKRDASSAQHFSGRELDPHHLSTLLWCVTAAFDRESGISDEDKTREAEDRAREAEDRARRVERITAADRADETIAADGAKRVGADGETRDLRGKNLNRARCVDVYVVTEKGVSLYNPENQTLLIIMEGKDVRREILGTANAFASKAPVILVYVANNKRQSAIPAPKRDFYAAMDCGIAAQLATLFCASEHLITTTVEVDPIAAGKILELKVDKVLIAQPVGYRD